MLALAIVAAGAPAGPEPHQHVLAAPGARVPDRVALLAGATPDLWSEAAAASEHAKAALLSSKAKASDVLAKTWADLASLAGAPAAGAASPTTPSAGGRVASRVMRDVTDGVNELLNDLPADKLRNDVQKIARLLGGPPR